MPLDEQGNRIPMDYDNPLLQWLEKIAGGQGGLLGTQQGQDGGLMGILNQFLGSQGSPKRASFMANLAASTPGYTRAPQNPLSNIFRGLAAGQGAYQDTANQLSRQKFTDTETEHRKLMTDKLKRQEEFAKKGGWAKYITPEMQDVQVPRGSEGIPDAEGYTKKVPTGGQDIDLVEAMKVATAEELPILMEAKKILNKQRAQYKITTADPTHNIIETGPEGRVDRIIKGTPKQEPGHWDWEAVYDAEGNPTRKEQKVFVYPDGTKRTVPSMTRVKAEKPEKPSGVEEDIKYRDLLAKQNQGQTLTPQEGAWIKAYNTQKTLGPTTYGEQRRIMIMDIPISVYDVNTGNVSLKTREEVVEGNKENQKSGLGDRFVGAELATKLKSKTAAFNEIEVSSKQVRDAIDSLPGDFDQTRLAKLASVLQVRDDGGTIRNFLKGNVAKTLTDPEINYVTAVKNLRESAFALRSLQGMGQGSDLLREAIASVVPGSTTPSKKYALSSLDRFDTQVSQLKAGIPGIGGKGTHNVSNAIPPQVGNALIKMKSGNDIFHVHPSRLPKFKEKYPDAVEVR